ncbi:hypothetical protein Q9L58_000651 [Maublancomyces gigas]|uniref:Uncharacterized protein n=1 Tax=Discina gigas TaxID=1032678 RepID=A0ABR3GWQ1_9PEZI
MGCSVFVFQNKTIVAKRIRIDIVTVDFFALLFARNVTFLRILAFLFRTGSVDQRGCCGCFLYHSSSSCFLHV